MIVAIVDSILLNEVNDPSMNKVGRDSGPDSCTLKKYSTGPNNRYY